MKDWPRWLRRLVTIPAVVIGWVVAISLAPLLFVVAGLVDWWRAAKAGATPIAWRLVGFLIAYLSAEMFALIGCLVIWVTTGLGLARRRLVRAAYTLQRWWANFLWDSARTMFGLQLETEGGLLAQPGPILVLSRHASIVDNILPFQLFSRAHRMTLRYVIKKELLIDPALDVAGNWLPNHFVDRGGSDTEGELQALRRLGTGLTNSDGLIIFPEGTRFTEEKRTRAMTAMARRNPRIVELAAGFHHMLPPRPGGVLALLEASSADVITMAHHGLEGFATIRDIWKGGMVGRTVTIKLTRIPFASIPSGRPDRTEWLFGVWQQMDDWLARYEPLPVTDG